MKKLIYIWIAVSSMLLMSCENYLDTENYTKKNTSNYPATLEDAKQVLVGIYSNLNQSSGSPEKSFFYASQLASDDCFGGGGENDKLMQALDLLMNYQTSMLEAFWETRYKGIFRANMAIETLDNCEGYESKEQRNQIVGEAYFMRAFFYHEMASFFGQVPLVITTEAQNLPKATPEELYAQIATDLDSAINLMYNKPYTSVEAGHATRWAAEALMARVFLFYTGYYGKAELPTVGEGSISKSQVIAWLEDCINNSGHSLVSDYRNIWPYTNKYTVDDYSFTKSKGLEWVENDGAVNPETIFSIKYSNMPQWESDDHIATIGYANEYVLHFGLRGGQELANTFPFGQGWGAGPVNPGLWNEWKAAEPNDIRREASIIDLPNDLPNYTKGGGSWVDMVQETDYWQKKYTPVTAINPSDNTYVFDYTELMYGTTSDMQLGHTQDLILIRLADVYLMHAELSETNTYLNKVRERAGLGGIAYSLENLQKERRWELAFEGIRWNDIRRWGIAANVLDNQLNQPCYFKGNDDVTKAFGGGYASRYNETGGFFPIPDVEISLSEGVLTQNDGWGTSNSEYTGWK